MSAAFEFSRHRIFPAALAASLLVHGAALIMLRRSHAPQAVDTASSMLWVRLAEAPDDRSAERAGASFAKPPLSPVREAPPIPASFGGESPGAIASNGPVVRESHQESPPSAVRSRQPVTPAAIEAQDAESLSRSYAATVSHYLDTKKRYPPVALSRRWQGVVTLGLEIAREGRLDDVEVIRSSGYPLLDSTAVSIAREAQPFPAFAVSLPPQLAIRVDVVFRIAH